MGSMVSSSTYAVTLIGGAIIIALLLAIILYMTSTWQPKSFTAGKKPVVAVKKKTTKK